MNRFDIASSSLKSLHRRPFVLWIGVLAPLKSPLEVIEIARALPAIDFVMIGSPSDASILDRLMTEKTSNVHYLGPVSDRLKNDLIRWSSAGITTSKYEGFGWTPFEFLTAGKPVLAYPLCVFREIYGNLIIYADDVAAFITTLKTLHRKAFKVKIESSEIALLRRRWSFARAASRIVRLLGLKSLVIFTRDWPSNSDMILGCDIVNWKLWRSIGETGIPLQIFANGAKYSTQFQLASRTIGVGRHLAFLRRMRSVMNERSRTIDHSTRSATKWIDRIVAKVLDLTVRLLEPVCYAFWYIKKRDRMPSCYIAASEESTVMAGLIVKLVFGPRLVCIIHDTRFYDHDFRKSSFPMKVYYKAFVYCLRYVDRIIVVSRAVLENLTSFSGDPSRVIFLWGDAE